MICLRKSRGKKAWTGKVLGAGIFIYLPLLVSFLLGKSSIVAGEGFPGGARNNLLDVFWEKWLFVWWVEPVPWFAYSWVVFFAVDCVGDYLWVVPWASFFVWVLVVV